MHVQPLLAHPAVCAGGGGPNSVLQGDVLQLSDHQAGGAEGDAAWHPLWGELRPFFFSSLLILADRNGGFSSAAELLRSNRDGL